MSTRISRWVNSTTPGAPPPPPTRAPSAPPPTVYPESSVSNPYSSRYTGRPSHPPSAHSSHHSHSRTETVRPPPSPHHTSRHSYPSTAPSSPSHHSFHSGSAREYPMQIHYASEGEVPIIARTSTANGRTSNYMIIPPHGQKVEILHPSPVRSNTMSVTSPSYISTSSHKDKPLIKHVLDGSHVSRSSASHHSPTRLSIHTASHHSGHGNTVVTSSGTRVTSPSGRVYDVHYV